jgi:hypothetical protein
MEGKGRLNTAEWWIGRNGPFTVPCEGEDDRCEFWALQRICHAEGRHPSETDDEPTQH